ncbi:MAG: ribosome small subunit-dependent GTPase A [Oscillospiraceae bacterium]|nr:ribosome small subunit-dependent GTPase A [Oscillospiraceae bacterium]
MTEGIIFRALSGFYHVRAGEETIVCKARGRFRLDGTSPLVGDRVSCTRDRDGSGRIDKVLPRRNWFIRPAVANIDALVFVAANTEPVTDPFLIDRVAVLAADAGCELIVCINKTDLDRGEELEAIYRRAGYCVVCTSAENGDGIEELRQALRGKICAFTGNSGVGKSSLLNALAPELALRTGEISEKLGRGRHTTRHVELFSLGGESYVADTPGFASFEIACMRIIPKEELQYDMPDFAPYLGHCRFPDCSHRREPECAIRSAVDAGEISVSRYRSYLRLYELSAQHKPWDKAFQTAAE